MAKRFFNPDFDVHGDYDAGDLERALRADMGRTEYDAEKDCPYDRTRCRQKIVRMIKWERAVEYAAANRMNWTFCTSGDMFHGCPVPDLDCIRRKRYNEIMKQVKQRN